MTQILGNKRVAVLLVNFTDSAKPFSLQKAKDAWASIARYWQYDSYGKVSMFGSQVFDWFTYPSTRAAFSVANQGRAAQIAAAKTATGVDTTKFDYFEVIFSEAVGDAWTSGNGAVFEPTIIAMGTICHELTHQFGEPDHSWDYTTRTIGGGPGEYWDQTDVMSAQNCWYAGKTVSDPFSGAGPHHCMFWKDKFGWLDGTTIRRFTNAELDKRYDETFTLYSRNEEVIERLNCLQILDLWIELDVNTDKGSNVFYDNYDTGLQGSGVVIHQQGTVPSGNTVPKVVVPDVTNNPDQKFWTAGQICRSVELAPEAGVLVWVWVQSIDLVEGSARVNISTMYPAPLTRHRIVAIRKAHSTAGGHGGFDYISEVAILDDDGNQVPIARSQVASWIDSRRNTFFVQGADGSQAEVVVQEHWIQTHPDGNPADNLLSLPAF